MARSPYEDIRHARPENESQPPEQDLQENRHDSQNPAEVDFSPAIRYPELDEYSREQTFYRSNRERYSLRQSELYTLAETGKFRAITLESLSRYLYSGNTGLMKDDLRNLQRQGLIRLRSARFPDPIRVVTLTHQGAKVMRRVLRNAKDQEVYAGLKKPKELRHDSALYEVYQAKASEIEEAGGRIKRVVLDYELKKKLNRELGHVKDLRPPEAQKSKEEIAQNHSVAVVNGSFVVPDVRIEYLDRDGNEARVDLEYLTETYRHGDISSKAQAGFHLYAPHDQASRLHRVVDRHHIMTDILSI
jgi:hypothetical protein